MSDRYAGHVVVISPEAGMFRADCLCGWLTGPRTESEAQDAARGHAASTSNLAERLRLMTREARLSRESTEKAVRRLEKLRSGIAYLHDVYAVAPNEPRCCSDCAANDISAELRRVLRDV